MTSNVLERLRNESAPYHDRVEANPYASAIMAGTIELNEYKKYLEMFYGFIAPLEQRAAQSGVLSASGYDLQDRRKTPMLEADLAKLGQSRDQLNSIPLCTELPDVSTPEKLLGCFYVIEGSTMGGQMITKKLSRVLPISTEAGLAYFNAYGEESRTRWGAYRELLTAAGQDEASVDEIVRSAVETFALLERWFDRSMQS
ncbi:biliverdin-producing heme oxygenase [Saccharibacillus sacchari]|uniref:Biliverdin-producing heme oxygenase n=1 Tax=Saccharibacillus sacchari TaxID=456493 RepID=A0ACC6PEB8_9BACL